VLVVPAVTQTFNGAPLIWAVDAFPATWVRNPGAALVPSVGSNAVVIVGSVALKRRRRV